MIRLRSTFSRYLIAFTAISPIATSGTYSRADELIWARAGAANKRGVERLDLETLQPNDLYISDVAPAWSMAIDEVDGFAYWSTITYVKIMRKRLDGSGVAETIPWSELETISDIAIDAENRKLYWTSVWTSAHANGRVARSNLDGSNIETVSLATGRAFGINVDSANDKLYWLDSDTHAIVESNLDGSGQRNLASLSLTPLDIAFNATTRELFWSEHKELFNGQLWINYPGEGRIMKVHVDTLQVSTVVTGLDRPNTITIDTDKEDLYWGDTSTDQIYRATTAGDGIESIFTFTDESKHGYVNGMSDLHFREIPEPSCAFLCCAGYLGIAAAAPKSSASRRLHRPQG